MKKTFFAAACLAATLAVPSFAQSLPTPTREQLESTIGGMGLSMGDKLSLRKILQSMREQAEKVQGDDSLSNDQKVAQIIHIRQAALNQTGKILTPDQQKQLAALLLPKQ